MKCEITVECANVIGFSSDVLVLKFAQAFYGVDLLIANTLRPNRLEEVSPATDSFSLIQSDRIVGPRNILFVGVVPLFQFDYGQIRSFARRSLQILASKMPEASHIAMTTHGTGYLLDEKESFLAQTAGLLDALREELVPKSLERITIVERDKGRAERLNGFLGEYLSSDYLENHRSVERTVTSDELSEAGINSNDKPHIFVAMPFDREMADVFRYGIQNPVNEAGFLCERVDMATYTGDVLTRIKSRIDSASLIVADLTGASPNVYLEVGYAWGKGRPTLLISNNADDLKFDVQSQRCILYETIGDLEEKLTSDLDVLKKEASRGD